MHQRGRSFTVVAHMLFAGVVLPAAVTAAADLFGPSVRRPGRRWRRAILGGRYPARGGGRRPGAQVTKRPTTASHVVFGLLGVLLCAALCPGPLAPREALAQELLQNGGFEEGAASWNGCGGVSVVDRQDAGTTAAMVRTGRYAARIGGLSDGSCGGGLASQFVIVQAVAIPAEATDLTLSFWFSRLGPDLAPDGNEVADLSISLSTDPSFGMALFDVVSHNVLRGWMPFRGHLRSDDLAALRGQNAYLRFAVQ